MKTSGIALSALTALSVSVLSLTSPPAMAATAKLSLVATSADGAAFDFDEYASNDITVQVTDPTTGAVDVDDSQDLKYYWTITPFDTTAATTYDPASGISLVTTDTNGQFVVPLPLSHVPGTYVLKAALGADTSGANAIVGTTVLTVKAGNAAVHLDDASPLRTAAGADHPVAGELRLEDGTGLPDRLVDLTFTRGTGSDPAPDAGFVPVLPDTTPVTALQVTTGSDGSFDAVLSDPAEAGQGTELGGVLDAATAATPAIGDAGADSSITVDLVSETAPAGSTLGVGDIGAGTPGQALPGQIVVTAPDDTFDTDPVTPGVQGDSGTLPDPVEGQLVTLGIDHGFFTSGAPLPSVPGTPAGDLVDLGATLTGVTGPDGTLSFQVGIARDKDFDDDGLVTATVTPHAGDLTGAELADWDTTHPLNGAVDIELSPTSEQIAPVDPAVSGNRTYYDVFARDQFGNPVAGKPVNLTYSGDLDDFDYSDDFTTADLDNDGDIWIVSFEPGDIKATATWNAPTDLYTDAAGHTATGLADVTGSNTASFYNPDFKHSTFTLKSSPTKLAEVGTAITHTVTVVDQLGNPVRGDRVQFFRSGPDSTSGEPKVTRTTNAAGQASYSFVGSRIGQARISAVVSDGISSRTLTTTVNFRLPVKPVLTATPSGKAADQLTVKVQKTAAGAQVQLYRVFKDRRHLVGTHKLDAAGTVSFTVPDLNHKSATSYVAVVRGTQTTLTGESNTVSTR